MEPLEGYTLMHEHMHLDLSYVKHDPDTCLDCFEQTLKELQELYAKGVRRILEVSNIGMGRDLAWIQKLEKRSGIQIVTSTGFYKEPFLPDLSVEEMAALMIEDLKSQKAQVIGEIGTSYQKWKEQERKVFEAAVLAHQETGALITTHTTLGTLGLEQARYLIENGVDPDRIIIGHMDLSNDLHTILDVLALGVNIGFDTIGKTNYLLDERRVELLCELEKRGLIDHVVLSMDITRKTQLKDFKGKGYAYLLDTFVPLLRKANMKETSIQQMLKQTPNRLLGGKL
ncbi:phosphotriesterase family protein [Dubosiella newyorkensis]|uniref:Phosphotriesterase-related protein n=1 Tax=Dubosiella newyorkensis TaxID=1862672 RepID=A0A1U7NLA5_9FIRM|nr:phosphotriesterase-related protein [Dubosiella newyorkensis]OLU45384.1 phosphotriesterase-related protein [Dubosiella newyorkensis]